MLDRIRKGARELDSLASRCSGLFAVHRAAVAQRDPMLARLVICRGTVRLGEQSDVTVQHLIAMLEAAERLEGYAVDVLLDGKAVSLDAAIDAVRAGVGPDRRRGGQERTGRSQARPQDREAAGREGRGRNARARDPQRQSRPDIHDASSATHYFLDVTGITTPTSPENLKQAFRTAAVKLHPDKRPDDPKAHDNFCF